MNAPNDDLDLRVAEYRINGFTVFENALPVELVDALHAAFMPLLEAVRARNSRELSGDLATGRGRLGYPNRYTVDLPWQVPFSDPAIYEHPALLAFMDRYWGASDYQFTGYTSNNPYPDSTYQRWHRDMALTTPHIGIQTCDTVSAKIPLVDTFEENGSFEILPGTQYLADPSLQGQLQRRARGGRLQAQAAEPEEGLGLDAGPAAAAPRYAQPVRPRAPGAVPGLHAPVVLLRPLRRDDPRRFRAGLSAWQGAAGLGADYRRRAGLGGLKHRGHCAPHSGAQQDSHFQTGPSMASKSRSAASI